MPTDLENRTTLAENILQALQDAQRNATRLLSATPLAHPYRPAADQLHEALEVARTLLDGTTWDVEPEPPLGWRIEGLNRYDNVLAMWPLGTAGDERVWRFAEVWKAKAPHRTLVEKDKPVDAWIPWKGGKMPVPHATLIDVRYRDGAEAFGVYAGVSSTGQRPGYEGRIAAEWERHGGGGYDIVAYRLADGWHPWEGGPEGCLPATVFPQTLVDYRRRDGTLYKDKEAGDLQWAHHPKDHLFHCYDIVAWRHAR